MSELPKIDRYSGFFSSFGEKKPKPTDEQLIEEGIRLSGTRYDDVRQRWELYGKGTVKLDAMLIKDRELTEKLFNEQIGKWLEITQGQFTYWKENSTRNGTPDQNSEAEARFNDMYDRYLNFEPIGFAVNVYRGPNNNHLNDRMIVAQRSQEA